MSRFQFVGDHARAYGAKRLCRMLGVSRSGFYRWRATAAARAARAEADRVATERIRAAHGASDGTYGYPGSPPSCARMDGRSTTSAWRA